MCSLVAALQLVISLFSSDIIQYQTLAQALIIRMSRFHRTSEKTATVGYPFSFVDISSLNALTAVAQPAGSWGRSCFGGHGDADAIARALKNIMNTVHCCLWFHQQTSFILMQYLTSIEVGTIDKNDSSSGALRENYSSPKKTKPRGRFAGLP